MQDFLANLLEQQRPFVLFRFPQEKQLHCYYQTSPETHWTENFQEEGFVFAPFLSQQKKMMIPSTHRKSFDPATVPFSSQNHSLPTEGKKAFIAKVATALKEINATKIEKVVLSHAFDLPYQGEGSTLFHRLVNTYHNAFVYYWYHPETGQWLGASPERLITLKEGVLSTVALAGTLPSGAKETDWTEKEKHEQQLVVDAIVQGLAQSGVAQKIQLGDRSTIKAGQLFHLQTPITAEIKTGNLLALVQYLHPTPAVGGLPKTTAVDYILANEGYDRTYYTGFLGPFSRGDTARFFVNLRCGQLMPQRLRIYTGAGITQGSNPSKEWEEIRRKATTFLSVV